MVGPVGEVAPGDGRAAAPDRNSGPNNGFAGSEDGRPNGPSGLPAVVSTNSGTARCCAPGTANSVAFTLSRTPKACSQSWTEARPPAPTRARYAAAESGRLTSLSIPLPPDTRSGRFGARRDDAIFALPLRGVQGEVGRGHEVVGGVDLREGRNSEARRHLHVTRSDRYRQL